MKVRLTTGGVYAMNPIKAEYRVIKDMEVFSVSFRLANLNSKTSCWVDKKIFFKDSATAKKEMNYLLKFICEECLNTEYKAANFKGYAEAVAADVNRELTRQGEMKERVLLFGKLRKKKDSPHINFEDLIPKSGDFEVNYLATPQNVASLWISEWELENLDLPFEAIPENGSQISQGSQEKPKDDWGFADMTKEQMVEDLPF